MRILVAGANGKTGFMVVERLLENNHEVRAMVRKTEEAEKFEKLGAEPVIADLKQDVSFAVLGCDGVVFAAEAHDKSSEEETLAVDQEGAEKLIEACLEHAVSRFIMISPAEAENPEKADNKLKPFVKAHHEADKRLVKSDLNYTIFRAHKLSDHPEKGKIKVNEKIENEEGVISRVDMAQTVVSSLECERTYRKVVKVMEGEEPIIEALNHL